MGLLRHVRAAGGCCRSNHAALATGAHAFATGAPALTDEPPRAATCPRSGRRRVYR